ISEAQGRRREASSEGSVEQNRDLTYRNRIRGNSGRTSEHEIAKSTSINDRGCKFGGCAAKADKLTSGGPRRVVDSRLNQPQGRLTATRKSAEGVVAASVCRAGPSSERRETAGARRNRDNREGPNGPRSQGRVNG